MEIFEISGHVVRPTPSILAIKVFSKIWKRDKSKSKSKAMQEFAYIEFMISKKKTNPYKGYEDSIKESKIIEGVIKDEEWKPDASVLEAMELYDHWQIEASPTVKYYQANLQALQKTINYLNTISSF